MASERNDVIEGSGMAIREDGYAVSYTNKNYE